MVSWILVTVGQGGIQVGCALLEHLYDRLGGRDKTDFFYQQENGGDETFYARCLAIDSERKVLSGLEQRGKKKWKFHPKSLIKVHDAGAGNNWARGYFRLAQKSRIWHDLVRPALKDLISTTCMAAVHENDDNNGRMFGILVVSTLAGGTGSGIGTFISEMIRSGQSDLLSSMNGYDDAAAARNEVKDDVNSEKPSLLLVNLCIAPFGEGEITLQHYNALLSLTRIYSVCDCMLLWSNDELASRVNSESELIASKSSKINRKANPVSAATFNDSLLLQMNNIVAAEVSLLLVSVPISLWWRMFKGLDDSDRVVKNLNRFYKIWRLVVTPQTLSPTLLSFEPPSGFDLLLRRMRDLLLLKKDDNTFLDARSNNCKLFNPFIVAISNSKCSQTEMRRLLLDLERGKSGGFSCLLSTHPDIQEKQSNVKSSSNGRQTISFSVHRMSMHTYHYYCHQSQSNHKISSKYHCKNTGYDGSPGFLALFCATNYNISRVLRSILDRSKRMLAADEAFLHHYARWGGLTMDETRDLFKRSLKRMEIIVQLYS